MDTTAIYIKMSQAASELQLYKYELGFQPGDYIFDGTQVRVVGNDWIQIANHWQQEQRPFFEFAVMEELSPLVYYQDAPMENITCKRERFKIQTLAGIGLWLPKQDQLQEMLNYRYPVNYAISLGRWCEGLPTSKYNQVNLYSMEQLWLAFVMKEKFNKIWNGEDWNA